MSSKTMTVLNVNASKQAKQIIIQRNKKHLLTTRIMSDFWIYTGGLMEMERVRKSEKFFSLYTGEGLSRFL